MGLKLSGEAFPNGGEIGRVHTWTDRDVSVALARPGDPAETTSLRERFQPGGTGRSGTNDFGKEGYGGSCPPRGHGPHRYYFRLLSLDVRQVELKGGAKRAALDVRTPKTPMLVCRNFIQ
jgi:phosphatidylethanolamine-binding protein (PEBP) family uncharacterized protein